MILDTTRAWLRTLPGRMKYLHSSLCQVNRFNFIALTQTIQIKSSFQLITDQLTEMKNNLGFNITTEMWVIFNWIYCFKIESRDWFKLKNCHQLKAIFKNVWFAGTHILMIWSTFIRYRLGREREAKLGAARCFHIGSCLPRDCSQ